MTRIVPVSTTPRAELNSAVAATAGDYRNEAHRSFWRTCGKKRLPQPSAESARTDATRCINGRAPPTQSAMAALVAVVLRGLLNVGQHICLL